MTSEIPEIHTFATKEALSSEDFGKKLNISEDEIGKLYIAMAEISGKDPTQFQAADQAKFQKLLNTLDTTILEFHKLVENQFKKADAVALKLLKFKHKQTKIEKDVAVEKIVEEIQTTPQQRALQREIKLVEAVLSRLGQIQVKIPKQSLIGKGYEVVKASAQLMTSIIAPTIIVPSFDRFVNSIKGGVSFTIIDPKMLKEIAERLHALKEKMAPKEVVEKPPEKVAQRGAPIRPTSGDSYKRIDEIYEPFRTDFSEFIRLHNDLVENIELKKKLLQEKDVNKEQLGKLDAYLSSEVAKWNTLIEEFLVKLTKHFSQNLTQDLEKRAICNKLCQTLFGLQDHILTLAPDQFFIVPSRLAIPVSRPSGKVTSPIQIAPDNTLEFVRFTPGLEEKLKIFEPAYNYSLAKLWVDHMRPEREENMRMVCKNLCNMKIVRPEVLHKVEAISPQPAVLEKAKAEPVKAQKNLFAKRTTKERVAQMRSLEKRIGYVRQGVEEYLKDIEQSKKTPEELERKKEEILSTLSTISSSIEKEEKARKGSKRKLEGSVPATPSEDKKRLKK